MKMSEVRSLVQNYSEAQLRLIVAQLYKALPKAAREEHDIDRLLHEPGASVRSRPKASSREKQDLGSLRDTLDRFAEDAYAQNYFAPNRFVSKRDRPKWRFIVKRLYKDLLAAADESNAAEAAELLEKLYHLLCDACSETLFSAYDPFQSVGIEQEDFFRRVLALKYNCEGKGVFINNALLLMVNNSLNRYTLHEDLMAVILEFLKTTDLKEMAVAKCNELLEATKREALSGKERRSDYEIEEKLNNLTIMGFLCYAGLHEYANAISYFKANYHKNDKEVALYVLLKLLHSRNQKGHFLQEYDKAIGNGITPRDKLRKAYRLTKQTGELPTHMR